MATSNYGGREDDPQAALTSDDHVVFTYINQWEKHSIAKIQLAAQQARNDLILLINTKEICLMKQLTEELEQIESTEINLNKSTEEINKFRQDLSNFFSSIYLQHDQNKSSIHLIKLHCANNDSTIHIDDSTDEEHINIPGAAPLTSTILDNATPIEQKQMLGERLFLLVQQIEPKLAAKITGMFLELDKKYILILIKSHRILKEKVKEAIKVLQVHQYRQNNVFNS